MLGEPGLIVAKSVIRTDAAPQCACHDPQLWQFPGQMARAA